MGMASFQADLWITKLAYRAGTHKFCTCLDACSSENQNSSVPKNNSRQNQQTKLLCDCLISTSVSSVAIPYNMNHNGCDHLLTGVMKASNILSVGASARPKVSFK